ncbi:ATP-dependent DNA helicase [Trichonephila clavipes]|nr:ATP-dependent DNA helicase [Trichonephila clavipes]
MPQWKGPRCAPLQIRELFAILICTCGISNPLQRWDKYKVALSEDTLHRFERMDQVNNDLCLNEALRHIEDKIISISGKKLSHFAKIRQDRNVALAVASSGIAVTLLSGGRTAHSVFKLPVNLASEEPQRATSLFSDVESGAYAQKLLEIGEGYLDINQEDSETSVYNFIDTVMSSDDTTSYPVEFLNSLDLSGVPSHKLELKVGVPVLLMRNLDAPRLCNGTRLRITELGKHIVKATIFTGEAKRYSRVAAPASVESDKRSGRPQNARNVVVVEEEENLIMKGCSLTVRDTVEQVEIRTGSSHTTLYDHAQSGCEICSHTFVGLTETLRLEVLRNQYDIINAEFRFLRLLAVPENEMPTKRSCFQKVGKPIDENSACVEVGKPIDENPACVEETATHIGIREAEDWFRPIDLAKECDIYISSRSGSHKEIPITYGYTQDPFKNKSQNFKPKIRTIPNILKEKIKIAIYAVIHLIAQRDCEKRFKPKESNDHIHNRINVNTLKVESENKIAKNAQIFNT